MLHALIVGKFDALWSHSDEPQAEQKQPKNEEQKVKQKSGKKKK